MERPPEKKMSFLRLLFWPVHRSEFRKVFSMVSLLFLLCISYNILRNLKDALLLTAKNSGAEAIPFVKVWGMLPAVFAATWIYTRVSRKFSREKVFYIIIGSFLAYFLLFAFLIHPNSESLHLDTLGGFLTKVLPSGFKGLISLIRNWTITTFYVISELWAVVVLTVLFWGFANDTTEVAEAKRTYGILNIGSNVAPILGGSLALLVSQSVNVSVLGSSGDVWGYTLQRLILVVTCLGGGAMALFYWINRKVVDLNKVETKQAEKPKLKLSVRESIRYISQSRYLLCLALIVLGYNIAINLTDILWKEQLTRFFTNPKELLEHTSKITFMTGIFATIGGVLFSFLMTRKGWTFVAILTPLVMVLMAVGFFTFLFAGTALAPMALALFTTTPLAMTVYFGSAQNCLSKAGKYSVFDATKEMAFLPLDSEARRKGKAAIDGLGSGIGKSGASLMYQGFLIFLGSVSVSTPYIAAILFAVFGAWIYSVFFVGKRFKAMGEAPVQTA